VREVKARASVAAAREALVDARHGAGTEVKARGGLQRVAPVGSRAHAESERISTHTWKHPEAGITAAGYCSSRSGPSICESTVENQLKPL
jgi:hypothetical protein